MSAVVSREITPAAGTGATFEASTAVSGGYTMKVPMGRYRLQVDLVANNLAQHLFFVYNALPHVGITLPGLLAARHGAHDGDPPSHSGVSLGTRRCQSVAC